MRMIRMPSGRLGLFLLGIWLTVHGALVLVPALSFSGSGNLLAILAIAAGILILMDR
jgi:hypothetical protein